MQTLEKPADRDNPNFTNILFNLTTDDRVLIPHAHPDDEILTAAATTQLIRAGITVVSITATDGERSTKGDRDFVRSGERRKEAQRSLSYLGIAASNQHFFGLPDGQLHTTETLQQLIEQMGLVIKQHAITAVITPGAHGIDGHRDHQAIHESSVRIASRHPSRNGRIALWGVNHRHQGCEVVSVNPRLKRRVAEINGSQFRTSTDFAGLKQYDSLVISHETYDAVPLLVA